MTTLSHRFCLPCEGLRLLNEVGGQLSRHLKRKSGVGALVLAAVALRGKGLRPVLGGITISSATGDASATSGGIVIRTLQG